MWDHHEVPDSPVSFGLHDQIGCRAVTLADSSIEGTLVFSCRFGQC